MIGVKQIKEFVKENLDELNYMHTKKVVKIALALAEKEGANKEIVETAAWLHDIGKSDKDSTPINHHTYGVKIAEDLLKEKGTNPELIKGICHSIETHMGPPTAKFWLLELKKVGRTFDFPRPDTKESKIIYDADMIDLCSPFGIAKIIHLRAKYGKDFLESIESAKDRAFAAYNDLQTKSGKELGERYFKVTKDFFGIIEGK